MPKYSGYINHQTCFGVRSWMPIKSQYWYIWYVVYVLEMAINCRIANRLIAIHSDRLKGYLYQNMQIVDIFLFLFISVINDTGRMI